MQRIKALAIPPAYSDVWICADPLGHLQATGRDARGRKQYRYHPRFREAQEQSKFYRMLQFGEALPAIRARLDVDLRLHGAPKRKVLAVLVTLLDRTLIRVGNEEYARQNHSYGLTTLLNRHVSIEGASIRFRFLGKSRVRHTVEVHDRRLARIVARVEELPGQELFHYVDDEGCPRPISSSDVNAYLHEIAGEQFTAKDFRTWWATVLALIELSGQEAPTSERGGNLTIREAVKSVAARLGNTPAICRKCYIHPDIFEAFRSGRLPESPSEMCDAEEGVLCILKKTVAPTSRPLGLEVRSR